MGFWSDLFEDSFSTRSEGNSNESSVALFDEVFGIARDNVSPEDALQIPMVNACISRISDVVASTEVRLYRKTKTGIKLVENDQRVKLLNTNVDNGNMSGFEFKKLIVRDYFLRGSSFFYIDRKRNFINDLFYLDNVSVTSNNDPFNKVYTINVFNKVLKPYQLLRVTRNSKNGITGKSIIEESGLQFLLILKTMDRMLSDVERGFLPKGFFKLEKNVKDIVELRESIRKMTGDNSSGYMLLNKGIEFESLDKNKDAEKEAVANSMEINRIAALFGIPVSIISGGANEEDKHNFINFTILPLLSSIEDSFNRDLLKENEKGEFYFAFETKELLKGNLYERFKAYELGIKNNILSMDEVRDIENMERLNFGFYKMNIADAFYYPEKDMLINVNSGVVLNLEEGEIINNIGKHMVDANNMNDASNDEDMKETEVLKGGDEDEDKD